MKKILFIIAAITIFPCVYAKDTLPAGENIRAAHDEGLSQLVVPVNEAREDSLIKEQSLQQKINSIGYKILNANKINKPIVFTYTVDNKPLLPVDTSVTKRQIIFYDVYFKYAENDDEIAAILAREISKAVRSYDGAWGGFISSAQIKMAPKKYELFADKRAVDYMVYAGYNPIGLITLIHKAFPQKRYDTISYTNLTSRRLAIIYEYIFTKYPQFLINNKYINSEVYQNFLLESVDNRLKLRQKLESGSTASPKYE